MSEFEKIITHNDFDGVVSAAICSHALGVDFIVFTGPRSISEARTPVTKDDVVCDLPYPLECGMWFDHHEGNLEELQYRNIDPQTIPGRFDIKPSCARVVYEYFSEQQQLPDHFVEMVDEADIIDSFDYKDVEDWRAETPGKIIDSTIKLQAEKASEKWQYLRNLILHLKNHSLTEVAQMPGVRKRYHAFQEEEKEMLRQIEGSITFLPEDKNKELIIIDLTRHNRQPNILKHLAYLLYPQAQAVIEIKSMFKNRTKTNNLALSMSLSVNLNSKQHNKDVGAIMRELNIGSGHAGAGAGTIFCQSKAEMLQEKNKVLTEIFKMFQKQ